MIHILTESAIEELQIKKLIQYLTECEGLEEYVLKLKKGLSINNISE